METTPEKMFIFPEENMLSSKIFLWSLKNLFQKLRQATFRPSPKVKKLLVEAWWKVKINFVSKRIFFSKKTHGHLDCNFDRHDENFVPKVRN